MKILITGDLVVNKIYKAKNVSQAVIDLFNQSHLNIVNLEAPVTTKNTKTLKTGPHLKAHRESTQEILKLLNIDLVTLANNHILDYGEGGVQDTLDFCIQNKVKTTGAGMDLEKASTTLYLDTIEGRIAVINFAENEWGSATKTTAGANPMHLIDNAKQIKKASKQADYVVVIIHGGHEFYNLPSPRMQEQYRFYAEQGATIVIGHHTHCISGFEEYNGVPIYYSLGNFLFTKHSNYEGWYLGLILELTITNRSLQTKLHPIQQEKESYKLSLLKHTKKQAVLNRISKYNETICAAEDLTKEWCNYVALNQKAYMRHWSPISFIKNRYVKGLLRKMNISFSSTSDLALKLNLLRCEAHADISKEIIRKYLIENASKRS